MYLKSIPRLTLKTHRIEKLPTVDINEPLGELELTSGYLDPLLFPLFTDYKVKNKLIW